MPIPIALLDDLVANPAVLSELKKLVRKESDVERIRQVVEEAVSSNPAVGDVKFRFLPGFNNATYNMSTDTLTTGLTDPAYIAHEIAHAENTRDSPLYKKFLTAVNGLSILNQKAAVPIMLGLHAFAPPEQRKDLLNLLSGITAALAGPVLAEEANASIQAVANSNDKLQAAGKLVPAYAGHSIANLLPGLLYQIDRRIP